MRLKKQFLNLAAAMGIGPWLSLRGPSKPKQPRAPKNPWRFDGFDEFRMNRAQAKRDRKAAR